MSVVTGISVAQSNAGCAFARPESDVVDASGDAGHRRQVAVGVRQDQGFDFPRARLHRLSQYRGRGRCTRARRPRASIDREPCSGRSRRLARNVQSGADWQGRSSQPRPPVTY